MSMAAPKNKVLISPLVEDVAGNNFNHAFEPDLSKIIG